MNKNKENKCQCDCHNELLLGHKFIHSKLGYPCRCSQSIPKWKNDFEDIWQETLAEKASSGGYEYSKMMDFISKHITQAEDNMRKRCVDIVGNSYEKLQDTKYYKELSYIEKQVYLSAIEDVGQILDQSTQNINNLDKGDER